MKRLIINAKNILSELPPKGSNKKTITSTNSRGFKLLIDAIFVSILNIMSVTIPVELDGNEYISEVVSSKNTTTNFVEYFIKINGDPACFVNFERVNNSYLQEVSSSSDLTHEFKEAVKNALRDYLATTIIK